MDWRIRPSIPEKLILRKTCQFWEVMMRFSKAVMIRWCFSSLRASVCPNSLPRPVLLRLLSLFAELGGSTVRKSAQKYKPTSVLCDVHSIKCCFDVIYSSFGTIFFREMIFLHYLTSSTSPKTYSIRSRTRLVEFAPEFSTKKTAKKATTDHTGTSRRIIGMGNELCEV